MECHTVSAKPSGNPPAKDGQPKSHVFLEQDLPSITVALSQWLEQPMGGQPGSKHSEESPSWSLWSTAPSIAGAGQSTLTWPHTLYNSCFGYDGQTRNERG